MYIISKSIYVFLCSVSFRSVPIIVCVCVEVFKYMFPYVCAQSYTCKYMHIIIVYLPMCNYICMYVIIIYLCTCKSTRVIMYPNVIIHIYICIYMCVCVSICIYTFIYIYTYVYVLALVHVVITRVYIYICGYLYMW